MFFTSNPLAGTLPIVSINEDALLKDYGLKPEERNEVEGLNKLLNAGLQVLHGEFGGRAAAKLAFEPSRQVAAVQQRTRTCLLRPFPLGLRFSGANMNPLPCWLGGTSAGIKPDCSIRYLR